MIDDFIHFLKLTEVQHKEYININYKFYFIIMHLYSSTNYKKTSLRQDSNNKGNERRPKVTTGI